MPTTAEPRREPAPILAGRWRVTGTLSRVPGFTLFLAYDLRLRRWRTLQLPADDTAAKRLARDAELLGKLEHPAVERILDVAEDGPLVFAVRDRLAGQLSEHLPVPPALAVQVVGRIAEGLAHAHDRGVLHGHVRPSVIRFAEDGGPVLTGFGVVPKIDASTTGRSAEPWAHLAPELRQRWRPDPQSEVYALGALLYTILTGRHQADLFYAEAYEGMLTSVPMTLHPLVTSACNYDPGARPDGVEAFRALLLAKLASLGPPSQPPWRPAPLAEPPAEVVPDKQVAALITRLGRRRGEARAVVIKGESSTLEKTPLPYVMPAVQPHKDPGFHDPFERTDPSLPDYVDRSARPVRRPVAFREVTLRSDEGRQPAPVRRSPLPALVIGATLLLVVAVSVAAAWIATAPARADAAFVEAVEAEQTAAGLLAESSPERAALEQAWFRFADARTPEAAQAYVRLAVEAGDASTAPVEATLAVERLEAALHAWESVRR